MLLGITVLAGSMVCAQDSTSATTQTIKGTAAKGLSATGIIKDAANGKPLAAVNVSVPGYSGALTDDNGRFTIQVPHYQATLFVSSEGFQSKEAPLKGGKSVSISLYEETFNSIYDVVQLPFGVKPRNQVVNATASINTQGAWNRSAETPDGYLQGKAAGVLSTMRSGTPNAGAYMVLRGYNSLYTNNQPLIVVDGMIYDISDNGSSLIAGHYTNALANIDVKDIENITVIKDGVSTYGTKAANGVVLITTSHAKQLATKIDFAAYSGMNFAPDKLPLMKSADFRTYLSDVLKTRGWSDALIQAQPYMNDDPSNPEYYRYHNNTDWQNEVFKNTSTTNYYLKVAGGDNIAKYALSMGYMKNAGVTRNTDLKKYNVRFNADLNLSRRLTAGTNLSYTYYEQNLKDQGYAPRTNPLYLALIKAPFLGKREIDNKGAVSPNLADTDTLGVSNPAAIIENMIDNSKVYRFFGSINLKYKLTNTLTLAALGGITVDEAREQVFIPHKGVSNDTLSNAVADNKLGGQTKRIYALYSEAYIDYANTFNQTHRINARAGFRYQSNGTEQAFALGANSATDDFISVGTGVPSLRRVGGDIGKSSWINAYIGADYALVDKYFLSVNMAVDGSSRFGTQLPRGTEFPAAFNMSGHNFAIMPSVGASWLVSSESFMSSLKLIDLLKLRGTYSRAGNDDIGNYTAQQTYVSQNLLGMQGLVRGNIANPALVWETNYKVNLGMDLAMLNERLNVSADIFQNRTVDMLMLEAVPAPSGFTYAITNSGAMKTTGLDLTLSGRIINKRSLKWDVGVTIGTYKSIIKKLPGSSIQTSFGGATVISQVNAVTGIFYGLKTNGVYATDAEAAAARLYKKSGDGSIVPFRGGDVRFMNINGDTLIDNDDRQPIGNPTPDYAGAVSSKLTWKSLSLEVLFTFSHGNKVYNGVRAALEAQSGASNQLASVVNRWRAPGQVTNTPKASWGDPMGNSSFSDRWIEDGSFARMKMISVEYNLPMKGAKAIKYVSFYVTGNNLLTFTKYLGYDPEMYAQESVLARGIDVGMEPQHKSVIAGVRFGL